MSLPQHLTDFLAGRPGLKVIRRDDDTFNATKQVFITTTDVPLVIVRPQTIEDVAALVAHLSANATPLVVRVGGHDLSARAVAQDAVQIDLRDLASVRVAEDGKTAVVGGGVLSQGVLDALAERGLVTAVGNSGAVGWSSWAMNGGYGIMAGKYGLGCDQIVGARVVLADGSIVDADERLLKAVRGAGPAFGVIVELMIKVYPVTQIVAGVILCDNTPDISDALTTYFDNCRALMDDVKTLPEELYFQPMILTSPGATSPGWVVQFVWAGPESGKSKEWLEKVLSVCPGGKAMVGAAMPADYIRQFTAGGPQHLEGGESRPVSIRSMVPSKEAASVIAKHSSLVKPGYGALFIHMLHGPSVAPGSDHPPSVFRSREPHLLAEILGVAFADAKDAPAATRWCEEAYEALQGVEGVMDETYYALVQASALSLEKTFGDDLEFLRGLKKELDPRNVFFNPMPLAG